MQVAAVGPVIRAAQLVLHGASPIHDARQTARQYIEYHADRGNEENWRQRDLNEVRDIVGLKRVGAQIEHSFYSRRSRTGTCSVKTPASRNRSDNGNAAPAISGWCRPINITCNPPGSLFTVAPAGQSRDVTSRISIMPRALRLSCISALAAMGLLTATKRSALLPRLLTEK